SASTRVCERTISASYGAMSCASPAFASSRRTSTWKSWRNRSRPRSERGSVTRTRTGLPLVEDGLCGRDRSARLHRVAHVGERHLDRGETAQDVELVVVPEVADPEHLA